MQTVGITYERFLEMLEMDTVKLKSKSKRSSQTTKAEKATRSRLPTQVSMADVRAGMRVKACK